MHGVDVARASHESNSCTSPIRNLCFFILVTLFFIIGLFIPMHSIWRFLFLSIFCFYLFSYTYSPYQLRDFSWGKWLMIGKMQDHILLILTVNLMGVGPIQNSHLKKKILSIQISQKDFQFCSWIQIICYVFFSIIQPKKSPGLDPPCALQLTGIGQGPRSSFRPFFHFFVFSSTNGRIS